MARYAQWAVFLTLFASLLIKVDVPDEDGYQTDIFGAGMVIVNLAIFVLGVLQVNTERLDIARELQSTREDGEEPREPADATAPAAGAPMFNFGSLEAGGGASNRVGRPLVAGGGASNRGMGSIEEQRPASGTRSGEQRTADGGGSGFLQSLEDREQFLEQLADGEGAAGEKSQKEDLEQLDADGEAIQSLQLASSNDRIAASLRPAVEQASDERVASTAAADEPFSFRQQLSASDERRVASALTAADEPFSFRQQLAASDSRRPPDKKAGGMGGLLLSRPGPH